MNPTSDHKENESGKRVVTPIESGMPPMKVCWLTGQELAEWDDFVLKHPDGLPYHLTSWKRVLESAFRHMSGHVVALRDPDSQQLVAGFVNYFVRSRLLGNRSVSIPFASLSDMLVTEESQQAALLDALVSTCRDQSLGRVEVRTWRNRLVDHRHGFGVIDRPLHHYIDLHGDPERLFKQFSRTAVRRMIAKAIRQGIEVVECPTSDGLKPFHKFLTTTRRRLGLPGIPIQFFEGIWNYFDKGSRSLVLALKDGVPLAAALSLVSRDVFLPEYYAEDDDLRDSGVGQLVYWELIRRGFASHCKIFSFGRTAESDAGLVAYKQHWATSQEYLHTYRRPYRARHPNRLATTGWSKNLLRMVIRRIPSRLYDVVGRFCYAHWG